MHSLKIFLFFKLLLLIFIVENKQTTLDEYRKVMPAEVFQRFNAIYNDKQLTNNKKLQLLDELFTALPAEMLKRLPVPVPFRKLPKAQQKHVHRIYYSKKIGYEEKMREMERLINNNHGLGEATTDQQQQRRLMPIHPVEAVRHNQMPALVQFDVPIMLQFSGHLETHLLRAYLQPDNLAFLEWLIGNKNIDEMSRARLVGVLLKQAYQLDPDNFPLPLNGDSCEIDDHIRNLGVRLMFGRCPYDRVNPFKAKLVTLKRLFITQQRVQQEERRSTTEATNKQTIVDTVEAKNEWVDQFEMFPEEKLFDVQQNDGKEFATGGSGGGPLLFSKLAKFVAVFNGTMHWDWHDDEEAA